MARLTKKKSHDITMLKKLADSPLVSSVAVDLRPVIAFTMKNLGCTYSEIGEALNTSRQYAEFIVSKIKKQIED